MHVTLDAPSGVCLNRQVEPRDRLYAMIFGFQPAQLVHVMARLRLADLTIGGPMTIDELSVASGARPDMLVRVMRGLESLDARLRRSVRRVVLHLPP